MKHLEPIRLNIKLTGGGIFHDTRGDVRRLAEVNRILLEKCNELVRSNNTMMEEMELLNTRVFTLENINTG